MIFDELYWAFIVTTIVLMAVPGPNVSLIIANTLAHGQRAGFITIAGTLCAMALQLSITVLGMTALLSLMVEWFEWIRWIGVAYLLYLGLRAGFSTPNASDPAPINKKTGRRLFAQGFFISATNPKTLLFFGAFLPQFVSPGGNITAQLSVLAVTALFIALCVDGIWSIFCGKLKPFLENRDRIKNRITGIFLIGSAAFLAMARRT